MSKKFGKKNVCAHIIMVLSIFVNIPLQLGIEERNDDITVKQELVPSSELDHVYEDFMSDYADFKSGSILPGIGVKMIDFTENHITTVVTNGIVYLPGSKVKSIAIRLVDNSNSDIINSALPNVLKGLPDEQPQVVQIILNFVLSDKSISTPDYYYTGPLTWTMGINYTAITPTK